jgi:trehalose 2-sulfotransferase
LNATNRAGHPTEAFCFDHRAAYCRNWKLPPKAAFDEFFRAALRNGTTTNGVFGVKIQGHHVEPLALECGIPGNAWAVLPRLFPQAKYIYLVRRDRRAQAISYFRAKATNEWWRIEGVVNTYISGRKARFNAIEICRLEVELHRQYRLWDEFFAEQSITPLAMDYETLSTDYRSEIARALAFLGEDPAWAQKLSEPRLVRQSDSQSEEWRSLMDREFPLPG